MVFQLLGFNLPDYFTSTSLLGISAHKLVMLTDDSFGMEAASILFEDTNQVEHEKREHRRLQNRLAQRKRRV